MSCTIRNGDCLDLMRDLPDGSVDMCLADPPYGTTRCKWDSVIPMDPMWEQIWRVVKPNGAVVLFSAEPFTSALVMGSPKEFRYDLVWVKNQGTDFLNANRKPMRRHENVLVFYRRQPTYNAQVEEGSPYKSTSAYRCNTQVYGGFDVKFNDNDGSRKPTTVLNIGRERGLHPSQKPVGLCEWLVKTYTNPGETVLDFCMGSGSTGVACANSGRNFIGFELDDGYFEVARKRLSQERLEYKEGR